MHNGQVCYCHCPAHYRNTKLFFVLMVSIVMTASVVWFLAQVPMGSTGFSTDRDPTSDNLYNELRSWLREELERHIGKCGLPTDANSIVQKMVQQELSGRDGLACRNFASATAGAVVADASPTWRESYPAKYFLFIPVGSTAPAPIIALQPSREVGDCWPMQGTEGHLLIHLAAKVYVESFTLEHIDSALHLAGIATEAPSNFTVYGVLRPEEGNIRHFFGSYHYSNKGPSRQRFLVQNHSRLSYWYIDLVIEENHGHMKHTCIYRFQVHGNMDIPQCST